MNDHSRYVELAALAAGGHLSEEDLNELHRHTETCTDCKNASVELRELVRLHLPLTQSHLRQHINTMMNRPDPGARERFIRRASLEGITFSPEVKSHAPARGRPLSFAAAGAGVFLAIVIAVLYGSQHLNHRSRQADARDATQARQQLDPLTQQNSSLNATISRLEQRLAEQQRETENLRAQVTTLTVAANNSNYDNEQIRAEATRSVSNSAQSVADAEAQQKVQEKLFADTRAELARLTQARALDQATIVADQVRLNELSEQIKTAKTNIDMQRQLATAGRDVRDLMGARQLHVVDVRDTDPNGKAGKAFGRVFLTEGKSLIFYAFDLNDAKKIDAKQTFQVWGQQEGKTGSPRSLGFLYVDDKAQRRWALKTDDPMTIKEIDSVFVTVEPPGGAKKPSGQHLLYANLGEANHP
jgi:Anti-sigma-K factor rskA